MSAEAKQLTVSERILSLQDEWDEIAKSPEQVRLTDAQRSELDRRLQAHAESPNGLASWDDVLRRVRS